MNETLQNLLEAIAEASRPEHLATYLPSLQNPSPTQCLLLYVTQPRATSELSECVTVETAVEIGLRMMGGLDAGDIIGIFPLNEAEEALRLAEKALRLAIATGELTGGVAQLPA